MTVVVGILNKQGVAVAADSAVTVSGMHNRKVYNSANKIFTLSKYHPVGIAIFNNAHFMGIPWEILIKEYRKKLGRRHFDKLLEYKNDFFHWLRQNKYFTEEPDINNFAFQDFIYFIQAIVNDLKRVTTFSENNFEAKLLGFLDDYINIHNNFKISLVKSSIKNTWNL